MEAFGQRLRDEVDPAALLSQLGGTAAVALQSWHVSVWLLDNDDNGGEWR